jgi:hypothetical protein
MLQSIECKKTLEDLAVFMEEKINLDENYCKSVDKLLNSRLNNLDKG